MSLLSDLEEMDYETILEGALENVPDDIDKRTGSIIYDTLAPACMTLAEGYANLAMVYRDANLLTALGDGLDAHGEVYGVQRIQETSSVYVLSYPTLPGGVTTEDLVGVSYQDNFSGIVYSVTEAVNSVQVLAEAETPGVAPLVTELIPLDTDIPVGSWFIQTYGSNEELDEDYRNRILTFVRGGAFPGSLNAFKSLYQSAMRPGFSRIYPVDLSVSSTLKVFCLNNAMELLSANEKNRTKTMLMSTGPMVFTPDLIDPVIKNMTVVVTGTGVEAFSTYQSLFITVIQKYLREEVVTQWDRTVGYGQPADSVVIEASRIKGLLYQIPGILTISNVTLTVGASSGLVSYTLALSSSSCEWVRLSGVTTI